MLHLVATPAVHLDRYRVVVPDPLQDRERDCDLDVVIRLGAIDPYGHQRFLPSAFRRAYSDVMCAPRPSSRTPTFFRSVVS